ncbi:MAG: hypothetical protein LBU35_02360, partial [Holosporales bacterium]|nr:hypothetical protein [Holosporales bacterium]
MSPRSKRNESKERRREKQQQGHRARLCSRLIKGANENMLDYEIVELMLFLVFKRKDTKSIAKTLISKFRSIDRIISAPRENLLS